MKHFPSNPIKKKDWTVKMKRDQPITKFNFIFINYFAYYNRIGNLKFSIQDVMYSNVLSLQIYMFNNNIVNHVYLLAILTILNSQT